MKPYLARTLFSGYKIGLPDEAKYVGVPKHIYEGHNYKVVFGSMYMFIKSTDKPLKISPPFPDKRDPSKTYFLMYYRWEPYIKRADIVRDHPSVVEKVSYQNAIIEEKDQRRAQKWAEEARRELSGRLPFRHK